ncbi:MAG: hypothetical protein HW390_2979 [Candidatus Brocadiaceae bacterium]|nr:hypothetical protein [Candidatus Brocadiaceae bacterium]
MHTRFLLVFYLFCDEFVELGLRARGIEVHKQVGCSRYWIDLAVIDNNHPDRYVLGIECDGAQYHTSKVARERDRLREQVLKRLGWQVHRIWSTDWFRNRPATERVLLQAIESAKIVVANGHQEIATTTVGATQVQEVTEPVLASRNGAITLTTSPAIKDEVPSYIACTDLGVGFHLELHEVPSHDIALAVKRVTEIEGPVHQDEVIARIRTLSGYAQAGQRMKTAIEKGIQFAITSGYVLKRKGFLWSAQESTIVARANLKYTTMYVI